MVIFFLFHKGIIVWSWAQLLTVVLECYNYFSFFLSEKCLYLIQLEVHYSYCEAWLTWLRAVRMIAIVIPASNKPDNIDLVLSKQNWLEYTGLVSTTQLTDIHPTSQHLLSVVTPLFSSPLLPRTYKTFHIKSLVDVTSHQSHLLSLTETSPSTEWRPASRWCWRWRRVSERISGKICQS